MDINTSLGYTGTDETDETRAGLFEERSVCSWMMIELYDIASQSLGFTLRRRLLQFCCQLLRASLLTTQSVFGIKIVLSGFTKELGVDSHFCS